MTYSGIQKKKKKKKRINKEAKIAERFNITFPQ